MPPNNWLEALIPEKVSSRFETRTWEPSKAQTTRANDLGAWVEEAARRAGR